MAYTNIDDPSAHFYAYAFSKSSGTGSVTFDANSDLQPDFLWVKSRTNADSHELWDSTRGVNSTLFSDSTSAEDTAANRIVSFDTDGFTWGNAGNLNAAGNFVSWAWKANGGTTSTNNDGSKPTTVQANTDAGFSILTFTTNGTDTFGHGLGVKPSVVIAKPRSPGGWIVMTDVIDGSIDYGTLQTANAFTNTTYSAFTSSVFQYNDSFNTNTVAYCFAEKQGFSKFGKYIGNGSSNGPFVYTGFKPAYIMMKRTDSTSSWVIVDAARNPVNLPDNAMQRLWADLPNAESTNQPVDFFSNGFKYRSTYTGFNTSGATYIYMAFAENPFVTSTGIPTTAR